MQPGYTVHQKHDRSQIERANQERRNNREYDSNTYGGGYGNNSNKTNSNNNKMVPRQRRQSMEKAYRASVNVNSNMVGLGEIENIPNPNNRRRSIEAARKNAGNVGTWR